MRVANAKDPGKKAKAEAGVDPIPEKADFMLYIT